MSSDSGVVGTPLPTGLQQCDDYIQFQNALRESRSIDDKIINALNNVLPTASFRGQVDVSKRCQDLWQTISSTYAGREAALARCVSQTESRLAELTEAGDRTMVRQTRVTLRMLQNETGIEDVIRNRTHTAFHEKCRDHYKPPS